MSKIFIFDMDGTILDDKSKIIPQTIDALRELKAKGHITIVATGRPFSDIVKDLNPDWFDFLVANNGGYFYDCKNKNFYYEHSVPRELFDIVVRIGRENNCMFAVHGETNAYRTSLMNEKVYLKDGPFEEWMKFDLASLEFVTQKIQNQRIMQLSLRGTEKTINKILPYFKKYSSIINVHIANKVYLDVNPKGVSKLSGIKNVLKEINKDLKNVIAFGDSGNDLDMLKGVGLGICMKNGSELAKEAADEIIGDNNSTAIADKIKMLI